MQRSDARFFLQKVLQSSTPDIERVQAMKNDKDDKKRGRELLTQHKGSHSLSVVCAHCKHVSMIIGSTLATYPLDLTYTRFKFSTVYCAAEPPMVSRDLGDPPT